MNSLEFLTHVPAIEAPLAPETLPDVAVGEGSKACGVAFGFAAWTHDGHQTSEVALAFQRALIAPKLLSLGTKRNAAEYLVSRAWSLSVGMLDLT